MTGRTDARVGGDAAAHGLHVVADETDDAGRIDKRGLGIVQAYEFAQGWGFELLLAAEDDVHFLQIR